MKNTKYGKTADLALIERLSLAFGPSGAEDAVRAVLLESISALPCDCRVDRMGNLVAHMRFGEGEERVRLMISAHMDEVGFMVTEVMDDGYLRLDTVGGIDPSVLAGRKLTLENERGTYRGVLCSKAIHHKSAEERKKTVAIEKLYVDIGVADGEAAEAMVSVGDFATFDSEFYCFGKDGRMVKGKALDDRMGCAAMVEIMRALAVDPPTADLDVYFCFTVREEIGLSGAKVTAHRLAPDYAIVLETTAVGDVADAVESKRVAVIGEGGALSLMDRSTIYDRAFVQYLLDTAGQEEIAVQVKKYVSGGNDAGHIHKTGTGVKVAALSVPTRYLHSAACVASLDDYEALRDLTIAAVRRMDTLG